MRIAAVIPMKVADRCKQRLAGVLAPGTRRKLVEVMLERVVRAVTGVPAITDLCIVTNDESFVPQGARRIADPGEGLNVALALTAAQLGGLVDTMLILPGDLPFITTADIAELVQLAHSQRMVAVADVQGLGTNALLLSPATLIAPRFGPDSLRAHFRVAWQAGAEASAHACANIAHDIDEPRDVAWLLEHSIDSSFDFLRTAPAALVG